MANENELTEDQKPFVPADTVDSKGTVWPTVGENIRKGVNGELGNTYDRLPDLDAIGKFWSKMTGLNCIAIHSDIKIQNSKLTATNMDVVGGNVYKDGYALIQMWPYKINLSSPITFYMDDKVKTYYTRFSLSQNGTCSAIYVFGK